jgi:hypothetical protein
METLSVDIEVEPPEVVDDRMAGAILFTMVRMGLKALARQCVTWEGRRDLPVP